MSATCWVELLRSVAIIWLQVYLEDTVCLLFLKMSLSFLRESGVIGPAGNRYQRQLSHFDEQIGGTSVYPQTNLILFCTGGASERIFLCQMTRASPCLPHPIPPGCPKLSAIYSSTSRTSDLARGTSGDISAITPESFLLSCRQTKDSSFL